MIAIIIIIISLFLDGFLTNLLPYTGNSLSFFTPQLTLVCLFAIYPLYIKKRKKYYLTSIVTGIIYDLLYTNLLLFNGTLFFLTALLVKKIYKNLEINYLNIIIYVVILIAFYEITQALLIMIFNLVPITITKLINKIIKSLLLNIIYAEVIYFIIKHLPKKYRKINLN